MTFRSRDTTLLPMPIIIATVLTLVLTVAAPAADACQPAAIPTSADNAPVGGRVLDLDTGEPVAGAVVILVAKWRPGSSLTEEPPRATTGSDGRYAFLNCAHGDDGTQEHAHACRSALKTRARTMQQAMRIKDLHLIQS